ncbi:MAG: pyruvate kinase [Planctomycetes bacterium]|nr:pyruvate kinase [Planctomycetota bacterium]
MPSRFTPEVLERLLGAMVRLRDEALRVERALGADIERVDPEWRPSARNLAHYLALRNRDLRDLQRQLSALGLSSLGRAEAHTLASIDAVLAALSRIAGRPPEAELTAPTDFTAGPALLEAHTRALLGPRPQQRPTHILVTMPGEAAHDPTLVRALVAAGMDCARINGAHDGPEAWQRIAEHVRAAARELGRPCRILVDLPGPKLRTAGFPEGPRVARVKPERGARGELRAAARVLAWAADRGLPRDPPPHRARLPLSGEGFERVRVGDALHLCDLRGRDRELVIVEAGDGWWIAEADASAWVETGLPCQIRRGLLLVAQLAVGDLAPVALPLEVRVGDRLWVVPDGQPARAASELGPARVGCTLDAVFRDARPGEPIHFDDGKISGRIVDVVRAGPDAPRLEVQITASGPNGSRLRGDQGINLPRTRFTSSALAPDDVLILEHAARFADMVGMSFVHEPEEVLELEERLLALGRPDMGIVLKIETARAFENLPRLILTGLRSPPIGVMVARGDLGVELGFERLAEVQEEILWLCEAAHVPVIWATQVLESLAKRGQPSRAEVTDAAMGARAECVMLNKGPYVLEAVRFLDDVLRRMQDHQQKKFSRLRRLSVCQLAESLLGDGTPG